MAFKLSKLDKWGNINRISIFNSRMSPTAWMLGNKQILCECFTAASDWTHLKPKVRLRWDFVQDYYILLAQTQFFAQLNNVI